LCNDYDNCKDGSDENFDNCKGKYGVLLLLWSETIATGKNKSELVMISLHLSRP
jgi:hypothetical protein